MARILYRYSFRQKKNDAAVESTVSIPALKSTETVQNTADKKEDAEIKENVPAAKTGKSEEDKMFLPIQVKPAASKDSIAVNAVENNIALKENDCKVFANDEDFLKLRKKMASAVKNEEMLSVAQKFFKTKCYSTAQVKNLSVLFLDDAGKYKFFDLAYSYVSDRSVFSSLQGQLTETYYISRFKALVSQ